MDLDKSLDFCDNAFVITARNSAAQSIDCPIIVLDVGKKSLSFVIMLITLHDKKDNHNN